MCRLNRHSPINRQSAHWKRRALAAQPAQSDMYTLLREAWRLPMRTSAGDRTVSVQTTHRAPNTGNGRTCLFDCPFWRCYGPTIRLIKGEPEGILIEIKKYDVFCVNFTRK